MDQAAIIKLSHQLEHLVFLDHAAIQPSRLEDTVNQMVTHMISLLTVAFDKNFDWTTLFKEGNEKRSQRDLKKCQVLVDKFVFPLNCSILKRASSISPKGSSLLNLSGSSIIERSFGLEKHTINLIHLKRKWIQSAKLSIMKLAKESESAERKKLPVTKNWLEEYCISVLPEVLPINPPEENTINQILASLMLNELLGTVKKVGLETLNSQLLECLIVQSFYYTYFLPKTKENLVEKLCYELTSAVGLKSWEDLLKRLRMGKPSISSIENDQAADFLCSKQSTRSTLR